MGEATSLNNSSTEEEDTLCLARMALQSRYPDLQVFLNARVKRTPFLHVWKPVDLNVKGACVSYLPALHVIITIYGANRFVKCSLLTFLGKLLTEETVDVRRIERGDVILLDDLDNESMRICKGVVISELDGDYNWPHFEHDCFGEEKVLRSVNCRLLLNNIEEEVNQQCDRCSAEIILRERKPPRLKVENDGNDIYDNYDDPDFVPTEENYDDITDDFWDASQIATANYEEEDEIDIPIKRKSARNRGRLHLQPMVKLKQLSTDDFEDEDKPLKKPKKKKR